MHEDQVLRMALACIRWSQFGECRTDGWPGPPPTAADTAAALEASLAKPKPVGGADEDERYTLERGADLLEAYSDWIKRNVMSAQIEDHPYLPEIEGTAEDLRALVATLSAPVAQPGEAVSETMQTTAPHFKWKIEAAISWVRNNYQDHNIGSLCDGIRQAFYAPEIVAVTDDDEIWGIIKGIPFDWTGDSDTLIRYARAILALATPIAAQPAEPPVCPFCGGDKGHWEGCRAPNIPAAQHAAAEPVSGSVLEKINTLIASVNEAHHAKSPEWRDGCFAAADAVYNDIKAMLAAPAQAAAVPEAVARDAARYRQLRRGQQWSVIDGIGDALRGEVLDAAIDRAGGQGDGEGS